MGNLDIHSSTKFLKLEIQSPVLLWRLNHNNKINLTKSFVTRIYEQNHKYLIINILFCLTFLSN